jgi:hypothetical protein
MYHGSFTAAGFQAASTSLRWILEQDDFTIPKSLNLRMFDTISKRAATTCLLCALSCNLERLGEKIPAGKSGNDIRRRDT